MWSSRRPGQATRIYALAQRLFLTAHGHAAVDRGAADAGVVPQGADGLVDLLRQLARRRHHEGTGAPTRPGQQALQHRQHEGGRLAGAGLRGADDVGRQASGRAAAWMGVGVS
jgi:hypothetical protein